MGEYRALRQQDRAEFLAAVDRDSPESLYRRFFMVKRRLTDEEIAYFLNIDFVHHVVLVAVVKEAGKPVIVGGARYIVLEPTKAEVAFAVIDQYQGQGVGTVLMRHLAGIAKGAGIREFVADVLPENGAMLAVFAKSGFPLITKHDFGAVHVALRLDGAPGAVPK